MLIVSVMLWLVMLLLVDGVRQDLHHHWGSRAIQRPRNNTKNTVLPLPTVYQGQPELPPSHNHIHISINTNQFLDVSCFTVSRVQGASSPHTYPTWRSTMKMAMIYLILNMKHQGWKTFREYYIYNHACVSIGKSASSN